MSPPPSKVSRTHAECTRDALVAPSPFGRRTPALPHRDRTYKATCGELKHTRPWG